MEKVKTKTIFADLREHKVNFRDHILAILIYLAIIYAVIFVGMTEVDFLSVVIFFFLLLPATVIYIEYTSLVEAGAKPENFGKLIRQLFRNAFRSGRTFLLFSFKTLIFIFLATIVASFLTSSAVLIYDALTTGELIKFFQESSDLLVNSGDELYVDAIINGLESFEHYSLFFMASSGYFMFTFIIYALNRNSFLIYADMFIERRPNLKIKEVMDEFFSDPETKRKRRRIQFVGFIIVIAVFTLVFYGSFALNYLLAEGGADASIILLRTNLISALVFVFFVPFLIRFNYYLYQQIAQTRRAELLKFSINEISLLIDFPNINSEMKQYLELVKKVREEELEKLETKETALSEESTKDE